MRAEKTKQMKVNIFNQYVEQVCELFNVDKEGLFTKSKRRDVVDARQMLYYLCHNRPMRIVYIQEYMGDNGYPINHSSIIHGINMVKDRLAHDEDYVRVLKEIATNEL
jgi:chromosomal replication initiator protein